MSSAERRRQVLDVGLEVFGRHGYHQTSMSALAAEAGVTKPVLYQHFASKHDLFAEVLAETGDRLMRAIEASEVEETPRRRVEAGFRSFFRFFEEQPAAFDVLYGTSVAVDPDFRRTPDGSGTRSPNTSPASSGRWTTGRRWPWRPGSTASPRG